MSKVITIDGPSASGKGSLSLAIAKALKFNILDSGLLYRAYAYYFDKDIESRLIPSEIEKTNFDSTRSGIFVYEHGKDITNILRSERIAKLASQLSSERETREKLIDIQRNFNDGDGLIADGRDMGTVVFPDADLKIFLKASPEIRAKRRFLELQNRGQEVNMHDLIVDIKNRDIKDETRSLSPLVPAKDSIIIDSSNMSLKEVLSFTKKLIKEELNIWHKHLQHCLMRV